MANFGKPNRSLPLHFPSNAARWAAAWSRVARRSSIVMVDSRARLAVGFAESLDYHRAARKPSANQLDIASAMGRTAFDNSAVGEVRHKVAEEAG